MKNSKIKNHTFSVIIPVYKEHKNINQTIDHIYKINTGYKIQILVIDCDPEKETINSIKNTDIVKLVSGRGRSIQMNKGAEEASGELLIFLHADTFLPERAFKKINDVFQTNKYAAGAFDLGIDNNKFVYKLTGFLASIKHRITAVPYGDQAIFIRKNYFRDMGGYKEMPLFEDVELMKRIKKRKDKIYIIREKVITSARKWEKEGPWFTIFRNWTLEFLYLIGFSPEKLVQYYYNYTKKK